MDVVLARIVLAAIALLVAIVLIGIVVGAIKRLRTPPLQDEPTCGGCGYIVKGLQDKTCPECGCDLAAVGVRPPRSRYVRDDWLEFLPSIDFYKSIAGPMIIFSLSLLFVAIPLTLIVAAELWPSRMESTTRIAASPRSRGYKSVVISGTDLKRTRGNPNTHRIAESKHAIVELQTDSGAHTLQADLLTPSYSYTDANDRTISATGLPAKAGIVAFMESSGVIVDREAAAEAAAIANVLAELSRRDALTAAPDASGTDYPLHITHFRSSIEGWHQPLALPIIAAFTWPALWLAGIFTIIWRHRHKLGPTPILLTAEPPSSLSSATENG